MVLCDRLDDLTQANLYSMFSDEDIAIQDDPPCLDKLPGDGDAYTHPGYLRVSLNYAGERLLAEVYVTPSTGTSWVGSESVRRRARILSSGLVDSYRCFLRFKTLLHVTSPRFERHLHERCERMLRSRTGYCPGNTYTQAYLAEARTYSILVTEHDNSQGYGRRGESGEEAHAPASGRGGYYTLREFITLHAALRKENGLGGKDMLDVLRQLFWSLDALKDRDLARLSMRFDERWVLRASVLDCILVKPFRSSYGTSMMYETRSRSVCFDHAFVCVVFACPEILFSDLADPDGATSGEAFSRIVCEAVALKSYISSTSRGGSGTSALLFKQLEAWDPYESFFADLALDGYANLACEHRGDVFSLVDRGSNLRVDLFQTCASNDPARQRGSERGPLPTLADGTGGLVLSNDGSGRIRVRIITRTSDLAPPPLPLPPLPP